MPYFGRLSTQRLSTCDERLQDICHEAIKIYDFSVLCGHRDEIEQGKFYRGGKSKLQYPASKHNSTPSLAVDIAPWPINWDDLGRFKLLAGIIFGIAHCKCIKLRWGGDWNMDWNLKNEKFVDLTHFELV